MASASPDDTSRHCRILLRHHPLRQAFIVLVRMIVTAALSILYMRHTGVDSPILGPPGMRAWLVVRGLLGSVAIFALYSSLRTLQLGEALSVYFTCPILGVLFSRKC